MGLYMGLERVLFPIVGIIAPFEQPAQYYQLLFVLFNVFVGFKILEMRFLILLMRENIPLHY